VTLDLRLPHARYCVADADQTWCDAGGTDTGGAGGQVAGALFAHTGATEGAELAADGAATLADVLDAAGTVRTTGGASGTHFGGGWTGGPDDAAAAAGAGASGCRSDFVAAAGRGAAEAVPVAETAGVRAWWTD
jgi:hypothetical protein